MKKIILALMIVSTMSCKDEKNKKTSTGIPVVINKLIVADTIIIPNYPLWTLNRMTLEKDNATYNGYQVFKLGRTSTTETAYTLVNNIPAILKRTYKASIIVKKGSIGNLFGLRIIGEYPNRVDAVFDIKSGFNKEAVAVGDFVNGSASIESLGDGWYKCIVSVEVNTDRIKIILGPTMGLGKTISWEASTKEKCNVYIAASSLTLEELSN